MATNDDVELPRPSNTELAQAFLGQTVARVTDTDPITLTLRTWLLLVLIAGCCVLAPVPVNVVGVIATVALALSITRRRIHADR